MTHDVQPSLSGVPDVERIAKAVSGCDPLVVLVDNPDGQVFVFDIEHLLAELARLRDQLEVTSGVLMDVAKERDTAMAELEDAYKAMNCPSLDCPHEAVVKRAASHNSDQPNREET